MMVFLDKRFHGIDKDPKAWDSMTKQSFRDEVDINKIMAGVQKTGFMPVRGGQPFYGDVSDVVDYRDSLEKVREAEQLFAQMPARIRSRFDNDPGKMLDFLSDDSNLDEAVDLGLVVKKDEPHEVVVPKAGKPSKVKSQPKAEDEGSGV